MILQNSKVKYHMGKDREERVEGVFRFDEAFPESLTIVGIPLTCNISHGIRFGFISYTLYQYDHPQVRRCLLSSWWNKSGVFDRLYPAGM